jgi:hypothetical protein
MKMTARTAIHILVTVILAFLGWTLGRAQTSAPAFELVVDSPGGETTIECVRGCELLGWNGASILMQRQRDRNPLNIDAPDLVAGRVELAAGLIARVIDVRSTNF